MDKSIEMIYWETKWNSTYPDAGLFDRYYLHIWDVVKIGLRQKSGGKEKTLPELSKELEQAFIAKKIGDILLEEAIWSEDKKEVGWISMVMAGYRERGYLIRPMNMYLYDGLSGVAVVMAELAKQTGERKYRQLAETLLCQMFAYTDNLPKRKDKRKWYTGAYTGEASVALAYLLLYSVEQDEQIMEHLQKQCQVVAERIAEDTCYDVLGGNAGAVLVLLAVYELTHEHQYLIWAKKAGDCLLQAGVQYPWGMGWLHPAAEIALTGFAHGASGMMLAFTKLAYYTEDQKYYEAAYQAYQFEQHYYEDEVYDWKDLRYPDSQKVEKHKLAWCHGRGGIVAARRVAMRYAEKEFRDELKNSIAFMYELPKEELKGSGYSLCHGESGTSILLYLVGRRQEEEKRRQEVENALKNGIEDIRKMLPLQECENFGLLGGIAGIAYGIFADRRKQSILMFCCNEGK